MVRDTELQQAELGCSAILATICLMVLEQDTESLPDPGAIFDRGKQKLNSPTSINEVSHHTYWSYNELLENCGSFGYAAFTSRGETEVHHLVDLQLNFYLNNLQLALTLAPFYLPSGIPAPHFHSILGRTLTDLCSWSKIKHPRPIL